MSGSIRARVYVMCGCVPCPGDASPSHAFALLLQTADARRIALMSAAHMLSRKLRMEELFSGVMEQAKELMEVRASCLSGEKEGCREKPGNVRRAP